MNFLLDTNIFIEAFKKQKEAEDILELLIDNSDWIDVYTPYNVVEETIFLLIKKIANTNYWQLKKEKHKVVESFKTVKPHLEFILTFCEIIYPNKQVVNQALQYIETYGLLPNDAFVLAFCKVYKIENLVSLDNDFSEITPKEGITLISTAQDLKEVLS